MKEKILNVVNDAMKSSFWMRLIDKVSIIKVGESDRYEVKFYLSFVVTEGLGLSEFDADIEEVVESVYKLLRKEFITEIKEVNYFADNLAKIVLICEGVE